MDELKGKLSQVEDKLKYTVNGMSKEKLNVILANYEIEGMKEKGIKVTK